jgi:hypothetical protein
MYAASVGPDQWTRFDNVSLQRTPATAVLGTECLEPAVTANFSPTFSKGADQQVASSAGAQTIAGWATHISPGPSSEASQSVDFMVSADMPGLFTTPPAVAPNGTLTYTPALDITGTTTVTVLLHDNGGTANGGTDTSGPQTFTIDIAANPAAAAVPVAMSDATPLALSNQFDAPTAGVVNQSGTYAFWNTAAAVFYRAAGASAPVQVAQNGDPAPGLRGTRILDFIAGGTPRLNESGLLAFGADLSMENGEIMNAVLTFDGTTLRTIVTGADKAPGAGGARFERAVALAGLNDAGAILLTANFQPSGSTVPPLPTLFIVPAGGTPARLAGFGDTAPDTNGGILSSVTNPRLNNAGDVLFTGTIAGGNGGFGLFMWSSGAGVQKVVASGDAHPLGGTFTFTAAPIGFFNDASEVAFANAGSVFVWTAGGLRVAVAAGSAAPAPVGGTFSTATSPTILAFNDVADVAFTATLLNTPNAVGLFRIGASRIVEVIAYRNQIAPLTVTPFQTFAAVSMNAAGTVSFRGDASTGGALGIFQQRVGESLVCLILNLTSDMGTPLGGVFGLVSAATVTLDDGRVYFTSDIVDGSTDYAEFLTTPHGLAGAPTVLLSTADSLPPGGRTLLGERVFGLGTSGDYMGFPAARPGGRVSLVVRNATTQTNTILATEGEIVPGLGGRLRFTNTSSVFVSSSGRVAFGVRPVGGTSHGVTAIFVADASSLAKVVANGDLDSEGRVLGAPTVSGSLTQYGINDAGQVLFSATVDGGSRGLFVASAGGTPVKVAIVGDVISTGATITNAVAGTAVINAAGQVAFSVGTTSGTTLLVATPGNTPVKIARASEAAPSGGTFTNFSTASFNSSGELVFTAATSLGNGAYFASTTVPPLTLARSGEATPAGGVYSFPASRPEALINDQHDIVFLADVISGPMNSAYFIRRNGGPVQVLVAEGQPAPGTTGAFAALPHTLNNVAGEFFQISEAGEVVFRGNYVSNGITRTGHWRVRADGTVEPLVLRGVDRASTGGVILVSSQVSGWLSGGRYAIWIGIAGGPVHNAFVIVGPSGGVPALTVVR